MTQELNSSFVNTYYSRALAYSKKGEPAWTKLLLTMTKQ